MKFIVTKNKVSISEAEEINEGEYKATRCQFEFDDIYDGFVKKAMFTNLFKGGSYEVSILDNSCDIPAEVLQSKGNIKVGVYAYEVQNDELTLRYSPTPAHIKIDSGSYISNPLNPEEITPTQFEQYMQAMEDGLAEVENVDIDAVKEGDTATITITNRDGETKSVEIKDGSGGGGGGGTSNYNQLSNKPSINGVTLQGNLTASALGINEYDDTQIKQDISTLQGSVSTNTNNIGTLQTGLSTEISNRENADVNLQSQIDTKQDTLTSGANISISGGVISATDTIYSAGNGLSLTDTTFSVDTTVVATQTDLADMQEQVTSYITDAVEYSASATYAVGDYAIHDGVIY